MDICLFYTIIAFIKVCCGTWYKASHFYRFLCKEKVREEKFEAHRAASADRRKSVYGDTIKNVCNTISTGVKNAQDTVNKLSVPGDNAEAGIYNIEC